MPQMACPVAPHDGGDPYYVYGQDEVEMLRNMVDHLVETHCKTPGDPSSQGVETESAPTA